MVRINDLQFIDTLDNKESKLTTETQCSDSEQQSVQDVVFKSLSDLEAQSIRGGVFATQSDGLGGYSGSARVRWYPK